MKNLTHQLAVQDMEAKVAHKLTAAYLSGVDGDPKAYRAHLYHLENTLTNRFRNPYGKRPSVPQAVALEVSMRWNEMEEMHGLIFISFPVWALQQCTHYSHLKSIPVKRAVAFDMAKETEIKIQPRTAIALLNNRFLSPVDFERISEEDAVLGWYKFAESVKELEGLNIFHQEMIDMVKQAAA